MLGEISDKIGFVVKGVYINNPIEPIQMPRSYGCLAILWRQEMDSIIRPLTDCGERLQCILLTLRNGGGLLLISAYLPSRRQCFRI